MWPCVGSSVQKFGLFSSDFEQCSRVSGSPLEVYHCVYLPCNYILYSCGGPRGQTGLWHLWSKQAFTIT